MMSLSTIHFYIILKRSADCLAASPSLSTIHFYIILKLMDESKAVTDLFEYHTFLHHSQTIQHHIVNKDTV